MCSHADGAYELQDSERQEEQVQRGEHAAEAKNEQNPVTFFFFV
jgi:hypothetical protein